MDNLLTEAYIVYMVQAELEGLRFGFCLNPYQFATECEESCNLPMHGGYKIMRSRDICLLPELIV